MAGQRVLNLARINIEAAGNDQVFLAIDDRNLCQGYLFATIATYVDRGWSMKLSFHAARHFVWSRTTFAPLRRLAVCRFDPMQWSGFSRTVLR
jgi:hypothetical protein